MATQWTAGLTDNTALPAATLNSIGAAWETWTPIITQLGNVTFTNNFSRYARIQKIVVAQTYLTVTGTGTTNNSVFVSLPITCASSNSQIVGSGFIYDTSTANMYTVAVALHSTTVAFFYYTNASGNAFGESPNIGLAVGDQLRFLFTYEGA